MGRTIRNNMENSSFFHIMVQGINKERIFSTKENKERYLKLIYKNIEGIEIIAYCIMDNHAHFLVKINKIKAMQEWMQKVNTGYAIYYNKINDRVGYVFRDRYKSQIIKNEKHLYTCLDYIHDNPVKAYICNKKEEYEFSSYMDIYKGNQIEMKKHIARKLNQAKLQDRVAEDYQDEKFEFIENEKEDKEEICKRIIQEFLNEKKISIDRLNKEKEILVELVKLLKYENNISYRLMEKQLEIGRERLRVLLSK